MREHKWYLSPNSPSEKHLTHIATRVGIIPEVGRLGLGRTSRTGLVYARRLHDVSVQGCGEEPELRVQRRVAGWA